MPTWKPYAGHDYLNWESTEAWIRATAAAHPEWVVLEEIGRSVEDRPLLLLTVGRADGKQDERPGLWLDGGTHASEWTGGMTSHATSRNHRSGFVSDIERKRRLARNE